MEYSKVKKAIKEATELITKSNVPYLEKPIVVVDYLKWETKFFKDQYKALDYLERYTDLSEWERELPIDGVDEEEVIIIKYMTEKALKKEKNEKEKEGYKFFKEVEGIKIYRKKSFLNISAHINLYVTI